ncbi:MAG: efflux RND transporter periplasmic adaptor subunit, partial [Alphaproteobacteria bacterium]
MRIFPLVLAVVVAGLGYAVYFRLTHSGGMPKGMPAMNGPMPVMVAESLSAAATPSYVFSGRFKATNVADIRPLITGTVQAIHFEEGQLVKAGDPLIDIDTTTYQATAAQAQAALAQAKAAWERGKKLRTQDAISKADMDARTTAYRHAQAAATLANTNLGYAQVRAPLTGRVGRAEVTVGSQVGPSLGSSVLTTIHSIGDIYIDFDVSEQDYGAMLNLMHGNGSLDNATIQVGLADDGTRFPITASNLTLDNQLGATSGSLRMRATVPNADNAILSGMFARVKVELPITQQVVLVNDAAIVTDQGSRFVWTLNAQNIPQPNP